MMRLLETVLCAAMLPSLEAGVVVVYDSGVTACVQAMEGLGAGLGRTPVYAVDLGAPEGPAELARSLRAADAGVVVAMGGRALAEVRIYGTAAPVVGALVLESDSAATAAHVSVEIPLAAQLAALRQLFPQHQRVGIIRNPARSRYSAEQLLVRARREGFTATVVDCNSAAGLLKAVSSLKDRVDFLLCFPDPELYNPVTVKPLVMATLEQGLPVVGFSEAFVRAGAAAGIFPDYRAIGLRTAEVVLRLLRGGSGPRSAACPRLQIAVNERVARLLGLDFRTMGLPVEVLR